MPQKNLSLSGQLLSHDASALDELKSVVAKEKDPRDDSGCSVWLIAGTSDINFPPPLPWVAGMSANRIFPRKKEKKLIRTNKKLYSNFIDVMLQ